jgi:hypothetical protein
LVLAGGASLGSNLSTFYIWILDPDLGLLPNWPIGVLFILTAALLTKWGRDSTGEGGDKPFYLFLTAFFVINFYAHSSTLNLNSGDSRAGALFIMVPAWVLSVGVLRGAPPAIQPMDDHTVVGGSAWLGSFEHSAEQSGQARGV